MALLHERPRARSAARVGTALGLAALVALVAGEVRAEKTDQKKDAPETTVLRGEVVETSCFVTAGRRGAKHRQCAIACARAGQPLGILDEKTKTLYVEVLDHRAGTPSDPLLPYVAERVEVRGKPINRGGIPAIIVHDVKRLSGR